MTSPAAAAQQVYQLPSSAFDEPALVNPGQEPGQADAEDLSPSGLPRRGSARLMRALLELDDARVAYDEADMMYDGEVGDVPMSDHVARLVKRARIEDVEDLCYARVPVDTIAEKLHIRAVSVVADEDENGEVDDQEQDAADLTGEVLEAIRKHNQMPIEEVEVVARASRYGDAYLEVWPIGGAPDTGEIDVDDEIAAAQVMASQPIMVDIYINSPINVRAFYDPEQPRRMTHVIKYWEWMDPDDEDDLEAKPRCRATIYDEGGIERWIVKRDGDPGNREDWVPFIEAEGDELAWPLPYPLGVDRIPFFHLRNSEPYGCPEHKPGYGAQRLINKLISAQGVTIDFQMFPQRYMLMDPKGDSGLINLIDPDNPEDMDDDPEGDGHSQLRADPGAVWRVVAQSIGQLEPADPDVFLKPLDRYIKAISELCGIPLDRFSGYSTPPSGESRKVANEVLYEKVSNRRMRYGTVLEDAYEFALQLVGVTASIVVKWEPLSVAVGNEDWEIVQAKINAGVPVEQALMEAGYPEEQVKQWLLSQGGADLMRRVALLNQVATAVAGLAAGVGVGMVSREQTAGIIARILGEIGTQLPDLEVPVMVQPPPIPPAAPPGGGPPGSEDKAKGNGNGGPPQAGAIPPMPPMPPPLAVGVGDGGSNGAG